MVASVASVTSVREAHYLWLPHVERIHLMFVFGKGESDTLSSEQKRALHQIVQAIKAAVREETA